MSEARKMSDAEFCRQRNIGVGSSVSGVCPIKGRLAIRITATGESAILARRMGAAEGHNWDLAKWEDFQQSGDAAGETVTIKRKEHERLKELARRYKDLCK